MRRIGRSAWLQQPSSRKTGCDRSYVSDHGSFPREVCPQPSLVRSRCSSSSAAVIPGAHCSWGETGPTDPTTGKVELLYRVFPSIWPTKRRWVLPYWDPRIVRILAHHEVSPTSSRATVRVSAGRVITNGHPGTTPCKGLRPMADPWCGPPSGGPIDLQVTHAGAILFGQNPSSPAATPFPHFPPPGLPAGLCPPGFHRIPTADLPDTPWPGTPASRVRKQTEQRSANAIDAADLSS